VTDNEGRPATTPGGPKVSTPPATVASVPPPPEDWREELRERVKATLRRRQLRRELREQLAVARAAGLRSRHAAKLRR